MALISIDKLVILLVEPSPTQHRIITQHLQDLGVKDIDHCHTAAEAMERLTKATPDLVVSAMHLPDMTGKELLQWMRESEAYLDLPYILISSETDVRYLNPMRQAGIAAILPKPYEIQQLKQALYTTVEFLEPDAQELDDDAIEKVKVLVVDDSYTSRRQINRLLSGLGVKHITEAENGKAAAELIENEYFDLIVTDYNMPEMDGQQLVVFIREQSTQPGVPIVMITSESDEARLAAVEQTGVSAIFDKPFNPDMLKRILKTAVLTTD